ncbi:FAD-dependent oxidoreductase [Burkholderia multivorans]|uniref:FAD-dependent oxidoreductase n=1 Tax=Burkholderia multivorans TaxID=87883 RepID=UPI002018CCB3|nr:FAD-dependent oxidoreductase [Burkholderia multivorans]MCA8143495.1 FAD-dependent oxidoreductase [Burkholderia multivorans]MCO1368505.1 FAD-dependent oxidoreductase [Burkholderia multivorans]MCO1380396.1 FAD-dependent oxidoreductase [Burkholderia multivorans]MDN8032839.1 FAD-dependent oxidoreductase [Burkholderia multivorans]UQP21493.1 FAD-dependent oxidoreductase [Burkholderia multivorans]
MALVNKVLIVGGGIGGMCASILLCRQGIEVDLVELNPHWAPDGAGITISGPTLRALREVGVVDDVLRLGGSWRAVDICDASGQLTATVPIASAHGADDLPGAAGIMRSALAAILADATRHAGVNVRLGVTFETLLQDAEGVDVVFTDGSLARYDIVIGADGVNSAVRRYVKPDFAGPRFTGQGSWRAVVPRERENSTIYMGKTTKAGMNPISATQCYLFVLDKREGMEFITPEKWPHLLAELLEEFDGPLATLREGLLDGSLAGHRLLYRPLMGHMIEGPWHRGRVVLLGDAVHATTPHLASGAGIAVEGALVLAAELARRHSLEGALLAYAGRHYDRARLVVSASARLGEIESEGGSRDEHTRIMVAAQQALCDPL